MNKLYIFLILFSFNAHAELYPRAVNASANWRSGSQSVLEIKWDIVMVDIPAAQWAEPKSGNLNIPSWIVYANRGGGEKFGFITNPRCISADCTSPKLSKGESWKNAMLVLPSAMTAAFSVSGKDSSYCIEAGFTVSTGGGPWSPQRASADRVCVTTPPVGVTCAVDSPSLHLTHAAVIADGSVSRASTPLNVSCTGTANVKISSPAGDKVALTNGLTSTLTGNGVPLGQRIVLASGMNSIMIQSNITVPVRTPVGAYNGSTVISVDYD